MAMGALFFLSTMLLVCVSVANAQLPDWMPPLDTIKMLISKLLGYAIISGAFVLKVPQIRVILKNGSAEGLSELSFELEAVVLLIHCSYGYLKGLPFNTYGEALVLEAQVLLLLVLIYFYKKAPVLRVAAVTAVLAGIAGLVLSGRLEESHIDTAFAANTVINMCARIPQIVTNLRQKSTGQLSLATCAVSALGSLARLYTTFSNNAGAAMLRQYAIGCVLHTTLVIQILFYSSSAAKSEKKKQ